MNDEQLTQKIEEAVIRAFSASVEGGRYIDVSRIPLICQSITQIGKDIGEIKESIVTQKEFWPVKTIVYSLVGLILSGAVGALLMLIYKH